MGMPRQTLCKPPEWVFARYPARNTAFKTGHETSPAPVYVSPILAGNHIEATLIVRSNYV